jgi:hypothetical protein
MEQVRVITSDDGHRSRLTVFFRLILVIPHLLVLSIFSTLALMVAIVSWFAILFTGRAVGTGIQARYLRYFTHVDAYLNLAANPYPPFAGEGSYPVELEIPEQGRQNRWKTGFRLVLGLPALMLATTLGGGGVAIGAGNARVSFGAIAAAAFLGWFACLFRARMPKGLRDLVVYGLGYSAQVAAYMLLVTDRYPDSDPLTPRYSEPAPDHPVRITNADDLRRSRMTTFFRFFLWLPHLVWLILWGIVTALAVIVNWFVTLFSGRPASGLHRFVSAYLRYLTHTYAFLFLIASPFPGFSGAPGSYPIDLRLPEPDRQNRWRTGFRLILVVPGLIIAGALMSLLYLVAIFSWFTGLFLARVPEGLRNLGAFAVRYQAQVNAYFWLLTDAYPFSGPSLEASGEQLSLTPEAAAPEPA